MRSKDMIVINRAILVSRAAIFKLENKFNFFYKAGLEFS